MEKLAGSGKTHTSPGTLQSLHLGGMTLDKVPSVGGRFLNMLIRSKDESSEGDKHMTC